MIQQGAELIANAREYIDVVVPFESVKSMEKSTVRFVTSTLARAVISPSVPMMLKDSAPAEPAA